MPSTYESQNVMKAFAKNFIFHDSRYAYVKGEAKSFCGLLL